MTARHCFITCPFAVREVKAALKLEGFTEVVVVAFPPRCQVQQLQWEDISRKLPVDIASDQIEIIGSYCLAGLDTPPEAMAGCQIHHLDHCFSLFTNKEILTGYLNKGTYLLTPGWLAAWRIRVAELGFDSEKDEGTAREFFQESVSKLLFLDTGINAKSHVHLNKFSDFTGLPYDSMTVGLDFLGLLLAKIVLRRQLQNEIDQAAKALTKNRKEMADYAIAVDVFSGLAQALSEVEAIERILDLFAMLFAPKELFYLSIMDEKAEQLHSYSTPPGDVASVQDRLQMVEGEYAWTETGTGFTLRIRYRTETVGIVEVNDITFPEYRERYLNLAISFVGICGLAIDNARKYQQLTAHKNQLAQALKDLQETQQHLIESEKMAALGNLVAGVAHEINTPVGNGIMATSTIISKNQKIADLYRDKTMTRSDLEDYFQVTDQTARLLLSNLQRTGDLIHSFKQVSVDESTEHQRLFKLKEYLQDVIRSLEPQFKSKRIQIDLDCDEILELDSYPGVFAQIISNLILNSLNHGFQDKNSGQITITANRLNEKLTLQYQDNGQGIHADIIPKIFDPFFTTNKQTGTGLGLHIVYNIVTQKLNGSISCTSTTGNGAMFTIIIPLGIGANNA